MIRILLLLIIWPAWVSAQFAGAFSPIPTVPEDLNGAEVELGKRLFEDKRLSSDGQVSCASCHDLGKGGADARSVSTGVHGRKGRINAPSIFNTALNFRWFWDGRAKSLEAQLDGPIHKDHELDSSWPVVVRKLEDDKDYRLAFARLYPGEGVTEATIKRALVTYEQTLLTPDSPFDLYLRDEPSSMSMLAKKGYHLFQVYGCVSCHQGVLLGGNMYQRMGIFGDYFKDRGVSPIKEDLGRYNHTARESDRYVFKVPSLRNVALTAPYFHDGQTATLAEAVRVMGRYQLGLELRDEEVEAFVAFLESLTGNYQGIPLQ